MLKKLYFQNKKRFIIMTGVVIVLLFLVIYFYSLENKISIENKDIDFDANEKYLEGFSEENLEFESSPISGRRCENANKRPYAVMLTADKVARPLSGISEADVVFEMPVITDGITRYMAIFQCEEPEEIGSIRSARHDFIGLADSFDAIYAHWGGSHFALEELTKGTIDNLDALKNPYDTFFRKASKKAPHNGFTSFSRLDFATEKLGYRQTVNFKEFPRAENKPQTKQNYEILIQYPKPFDAGFRYSSKRNSYFRSVNGFKDIDSINNKQVVVNNLIIMEALSKQIEGQYNDVMIESSGDASVYRNGEIVRGTWERKSDRYYFYDKNKKEIDLVPGKIWIAVVQLDQKVSIKNL